MIKKVFKGSINGKEYTNEQEFRKALIEAIDSGEDINASSRYETKEISEENLIKNNKSTHKLFTDKELDRFEKLFSEEYYNSFKILNSLFKF